MLIEAISSNALRIVMAGIVGALLYFPSRRWPLIMALVGFAASFLIAFSFLFDAGEVYSYSAYYKRAFSFFGDDVTTWLAPLFVWAILSVRHVLSASLAMAILFSGTKVSIGVLGVELALLWFLRLPERTKLAINTARALGIGVVTYIVLILLSPFAVFVANSAISHANTAIVAGGALLGDCVDADGLEDKLRGFGNEKPFAPTTSGVTTCSGLNCLYQHLQRPLEDRLYSSAAGLWMSLQGGFSGDRYPVTSVQFADLMIEANPFGLNDRFGISYERWLSIGAVQTPYLQFAAGYGIWLTIVVISFVAFVAFIGVRNIFDGEHGPMLAFTVFFCVNAVLNQTQPWLLPGPVLVMMGFCGMHIILWRLMFMLKRGAVSRP